MQKTIKKRLRISNQSCFCKIHKLSTKVAYMWSKRIFLDFFKKQKPLKPFVSTVFDGPSDETCGLCPQICCAKSRLCSPSAREFKSLYIQITYFKRFHLVSLENETIESEVKPYRSVRQIGIYLLQYIAIASQINAAVTSACLSMLFIKRSSATYI